MSSKPVVLIADDEAVILEAWREALSDRFDVRLYADALAALRHIESEGIDVALLDVRMPGMDGMALLGHVRRLQPDAEVIMITGHGTIQLAVEAIQRGAYDFLCKPVEDLEAAVRRIDSAVERKRLRELNATLNRRLEAFGPETNLIGESRVMQRVRQLVDQIADGVAPVLIRGESGTGKELVARALHQRGNRRLKPFVAVNCAAVSETLIDSELFGHERGAFTGAQVGHKGLFEAADGGILFLDEIGDVPRETQVRLLRALQEGEIRAVGSARPRKVDVRVVAATNVDLERAMREGRFREDLYYRISTFVIELHPLRERRLDVALIARYLLEKAARRSGREVRGFSNEALEALVRYPWPGNVRELMNAIEHAATLANGPTVELQHLPTAVAAGIDLGPRPSPTPQAIGTSACIPFADARAELLEDFERRYLENLLAICDGNLSEASRRSGIDRSNLRRMLRRAGLLADKYRRFG